MSQCPHPHIFVKHVQPVNNSNYVLVKKWTWKYATFIKELFTKSCYCLCTLWQWWKGHYGYTVYVTFNIKYLLQKSNSGVGWCKDGYIFMATMILCKQMEFTFVYIQSSIHQRHKLVRNAPVSIPFMNSREKKSYLHVHQVKKKYALLPFRPEANHVDNRCRARLKYKMYNNLRTTLTGTMMFLVTGFV